MDAYTQSNQELWDEWAAIHEHSSFYNLDGFKAGRCSLNSIELDALGEVTGKSLLHLQCHFGMDTLIGHGAALASPEPIFPKPPLRGRDP